jgi:N-hydroxyarylamine O-acetyltransferase
MSFDLDAYFARIAYDGPRTPTLETLQRIQLLHPVAIPFENLDSLHGRVPALDADSLQAKLVGSRRGGYCFEHNTLLKLALEALGFRVTRLLARVCWNSPPGHETGRGHMLLRVEIGDDSWIADVGFGSTTLTAPLRLALDVEQTTPHERFRLVRFEDRIEQQIHFEQGWLPVYRFTLLNETDEDIAMSNWYVATNPNSGFVKRLVVARAALDGRITLANTILTIRRNGTVEKRELPTRDALIAALAAEFGIEGPNDMRFDQVFTAS